MISFRLVFLVGLFLNAGYGGREKRFLPWGSPQFGGIPTISLNDLMRGFGGGENFGFGGGGGNSGFGGLGFGGGGGGGDFGFGGGTETTNDNPPSSGGGGGGGDYHQAALEATNQYRKKHGASPLVLDAQLSKESQAWAEKLASSGSMQHSSADGYGENLWMMSGRILDSPEAARKAVKSWYDEVKDYKWTNPTFSGSTGHFTALVWKGTQKMGIGLATNPARKSTFIVARYVPAGNMMGAFKENVGPLQK